MDSAKARPLCVMDFFPFAEDVHVVTLCLRNIGKKLDPGAHSIKSDALTNSIFI
jgi:hypothetical protein